MKHPWSPQQFGAGARRAGRGASVISAAQAAGTAIKQRDPDLPVIFTLPHLSHLAGVPLTKVIAYARRSLLDPYRVFRLKKRAKGRSRAPSRGHRVICVPEPSLMRLQRWIAQNLLKTTAAAPHASSFAYYPHRGLLSAAGRHAGCAWLVKMDIRDFFDSITERRVYRVFRELGYGALLSVQLARICTRVRQGDPGHSQ